MILFGASGHAKVIMDIVQKQGDTVSYLMDDNPAIKELLGKKVTTFSPSLDLPKECFVVSIGENRIRKAIVQKLKTQFAKVVHPGAVLDESVEVGDGTVVMAGAVVNSCSLIGKHVIINTGARIDHDCKIGHFTHIAPGAILCGGITVGEGSQIGAGATIIPNLTIGKWVTIGAGAVIIKDVPDGAVVVGNPGRVIKIRNVEE